MMEIEDVEVGREYRNLKTGHIYNVLHLAMNSEAPAQWMVVYHRCDASAPKTDTVWVRPLDLFCQKFEVAA